ncbi:cobalamin-dependent protein [Burkholderia sp. Ac-20353]|uniref:cobalamin-dependent protein n=1 Tax=Burkholderia sp. Ac-20353 TaxID=2703894 RepID=UPI001F12188B|nr:cobalamin-dependent protein [Burkholderia sp. Ac-20353]
MWLATKNRAELLSKRIGRKPRILIAKLGQDGHDRGAAVVASAGYDVVRMPLFQQPASVAAAAEAADVDLVGISSLSGAHLELVDAVLRELVARGSTIPVVLGGVVPERHAEQLRNRGVAATFGLGVPLVVDTLCSCVEKMYDGALASAPI